MRSKAEPGRQGGVARGRAPTASSAAPFLDLQRAVGNRATARLLGAQDSFLMGPAAELCAREAAAVAARMVRPRSPAALHSPVFVPAATTGKELLARELTARSTVQRKLNFSVRQLDAVQGTMGTLKGRLIGDTFSQLRDLITAYNRTEDRGTLAKIRTVCQQYLFKYREETDFEQSKKSGRLAKSKENDPETKKRVEVVRKLKREVEDIFLREEDPEALKAAGVAAAEKQYLKDAYDWRSPTALEHQIKGPQNKTPVQMLGKGQTAPGHAGAGDAALELMQRYGLTEGEILAIRTYTTPDYQYINPATAYSASWMFGQNEGQNQKTLFEEGGLHAGMMMKGLAKLPKQSGKTFRGSRVSPSEFEEMYEDRKVVQFNAFGSSATERGPAENFANGGGDVAPRGDQTVRVMCEVQVNNGRSVAPFSAMGSAEKEWLLLPGSQFMVTSIVKEEGEFGGRPPATHSATVSLTQTK